MKITIVGAGRVGSALGQGFSRVGHDVTFAVRQPETIHGEVPGVRAVALPGSAAVADVLVLAVPFAAAPEALSAVAPPAHTIVVDVSNPFREKAPNGFESGTEWLASHHPTVRLVKAFNVLGAEHMADPSFVGDAKAVLPVASDDDDARAVIVELANEMGFQGVPVGGLSAASTLEAAARYWGLLAFGGGLGRNVALGVIHAD